MIDITKPLQDSNGDPVTYINEHRRNDELRIRMKDGTIRYFRKDGTRSPRFSTLRNVTISNIPETPMINRLAPLELSDGTPVTNLNHPYPGSLMDEYVYVSVGMGFGETRIEFDLKTGESRYKGNLDSLSKASFLRGRTLRNRTTLDLGKPMELRGSKRPVTFVAHAPNGHLIVEVDYGFNGGKVLERRFPDGRKLTGTTTRLGTTFDSGDDVVNKQVLKTVHYNVYSDGGRASKGHTSLDTAKKYSRVGATRVGIVSITTEVATGKAVKSVYLALQPYTRTSSTEQSEAVAA